MLQPFINPSLNVRPPDDGRMSVMDAIFARRSVRDFASRVVSEATIHMLLYAAVQAPTAMHQEPWCFAVIQDGAMLHRLSEEAKRLMATPGAAASAHAADFATDPDFNIFYNGGTLIAIFAERKAPFAETDCTLAAANLMLAACGMGLGTCPIGLAVGALNTPDWKAALNMPPDALAVLPILIGYPAGATPSTSRKAPEVTFWKRTSSA